MSEELNPCCEDCVNYEPIAIGIDCSQFHNFCVEHQYHVNPKKERCKDFKSYKRMEQEG